MNKAYNQQAKRMQDVFRGSIYYAYCKWKIILHNYMQLCKIEYPKITNIFSMVDSKNKNDVVANGKWILPSNYTGELEHIKYIFFNKEGFGNGNFNTIFLLLIFILIYIIYTLGQEFFINVSIANHKLWFPRASIEHFRW